MKVFHICSYYNTSKVHDELFNALDSKGIEQTIFVPLKDRDNYNKKKNVIYSFCLRPFMKISLFLKSLCILIAILRRFSIKELSEYDVIHAHTLFADGLSAFILSKICKTKYIVSIRNTDFNTYLKYFYHLRFIGRLITKSSSGVVFISPSYFDKFKKKYPLMIINVPIYKIPNGINDYWLNNMIKMKKNKKVDDEIIILSIGYFDRNKNLGTAFKAVEYLFNQGVNIKILFVGGDESNFIDTYKIEPNCNFVEFFGIVKDKNLLLDIYSKSDVLLLPSYNETFGLVYIEAISQGLKVICTKGQGIDGLINVNTGIAKFCNPSDYISIADNIRELIFNDIEPENININKYKWSEISSEYILNVYK